MKKRFSLLIQRTRSDCDPEDPARSPPLHRACVAARPKRRSCLDRQKQFPTPTPAVFQRPSRTEVYYLLSARVRQFILLQLPLARFLALVVSSSSQLRDSFAKAPWESPRGGLPFARNHNIRESKLGLKRSARFKNPPSIEHARGRASVSRSIVAAN